MGRLRAGVIGLRMGRQHVEAYKANPHTELVALCDLNPEAIETVRTMLGEDGANVKAYTSSEAMFQEADLDVVSVTTPNRFHAPLSIQALEYGVHTLCTKPVARTPEEGVAMLEAARRADRTLMLGTQRPYTTSAQHLKRLIDEGHLGEIYHVEMTYLRRKCTISPSFLDRTISGGGPLIDLGIHMLDLALWLLDLPRAIHVHGVAHHRLLPLRRPEATVEDYLSSTIAFEGGLTMTLRTSYEANLPGPSIERNVTLLGTKMGVSYDPWTGEFTYGDLESTRQETIEEASPKKNQQYSVDAFVDAVLAGKRMWETIERGIEGLRIIEAAYRSADQGGLTVHIDANGASQT